MKVFELLENDDWDNEEPQEPEVPTDQIINYIQDVLRSFERSLSMPEFPEDQKPEFIKQYNDWKKVLASVKAGGPVPNNIKRIFNGVTGKQRIKAVNSYTHKETIIINQLSRMMNNHQIDKCNSVTPDSVMFDNFTWEPETQEEQCDPAYFVAINSKVKPILLKLGKQYAEIRKFLDDPE